MSEKNLSIFDRVLLIVGGFLLVLVATVIGIAIQGTVSETQLFNQYIQPFTLAAAGLGTGHYIGRSLREQNSIHINFATGFFIGIFSQSIFFTFEQGVSLGEIGILLPYPVIVIITALFALVMHLSPAIPNDEDFTKIMTVFAGPATTAFLVISSILKFLLSLDLPSENGIPLGFALIMVLLIIGFAYIKGVDVGKDIETES
ncbi:hypothetical protein [Halorubrum salinum]|uniref:hypothetical protein n=1 Tax=Halorubrum salinum TaxID=767517 RepID=UPI00211242FA|nr:hypothetical protein [Halorubrum salinum]